MDEVKTCIVAGCTNTSHTSDKLFIPLPPLECKSLCDLTGVSDVENAGLFYCEDHFNLLYNCENFTESSLQQDVFHSQLNVNQSLQGVESLLDPHQKNSCITSDPEANDSIPKTVESVDQSEPQIHPSGSFDIIEESFSNPENEEIIIIQMDEPDLEDIDNTSVSEIRLEMPFPKGSCAFATADPNTLYQQLQKSKVIRYECSQCNFNSLKPTVIHQHMMVHVEQDKAKSQSSKKVYKCNKCSFETRLLKDMYKHYFVHQVSENKNIFKCKLCDFVAAEKRELERHEKQVHYLNRRLMRCDFCSFTTMSESQYDNHICHDNMFGNSE